MSFIFEDTEFDEIGFMKELDGDSDRAVAIICAALIDEKLTDCLVKYMHAKKKITDDLFSPSGALGNFAVRADVGFLIGMYGEVAHQDLRTIAKIRNAFAHQTKVNSFSMSPVST